LFLRVGTLTTRYCNVMLHKVDDTCAFGLQA
jgi:hypothetical protein